MTSRPMERRRPQVDDAREFLEITRDFIDPRDAIREAISNSIDWGATEVRIAVTEDHSRPDEELIIEIEDDGAGLTEERLWSRKVDSYRARGAAQGRSEQDRVQGARHENVFQ